MLVRHARPAGRGLGLPAGERARRHDGGRRRRLRAPDARAQSLRLDPADPAKLASNWDVVCVAPELERGHADYGRFVRRHAHLHAPCEDGTIETGPVARAPRALAVRPAARPSASSRSTSSSRSAPPTATPRARAGASACPTAASTSTCSSSATRAARRPRRAAARRSPASRPPRLRWLRAAARLPAAAAAGVGGGRGLRRVRRARRAARRRSRARCSFGVRPEGWVRVSLPDADVERRAATSARRSTSCSAAARCRATSSRARS